MPATRWTTVQQRREIVRMREAGASIRVIAGAMQLSAGTVHKWVQRGSSGDLQQLASQLGRPRRGPLAGFDPAVREAVVRLKRKNPGWGAARLARKLSAEPQLAGQPLPSGTTIWRFWCSQAEPAARHRRSATPAPPPVQAENERWQFDAIESVEVTGLGYVTIAQARDPIGRCTMLSTAFVGQPGKRTVKLTFAQVQEACRLGFARWGLPDALQTDHASIFIDTDPEAFPTYFQLWLVALLIRHDLIPWHRPTANGGVERAHRTTKECSLAGHSFASLEELQRQLAQDWEEANTIAPSRAATCAGRPPLVAHPNLRQPHRSYTPDDEATLFDMKRVDAYLASCTWLRTVNSNGVVSLGNQRYSLGRAWAHRTVSARFQPEDRSLLFTCLPPVPPAGPATKALSAHGLTKEDIMGPVVIQPPLPLQLMLCLNRTNAQARS